jgi:hypothetical protein
MAGETNFRTATNTTRVVEIRFPLFPVLAHHALFLSLFYIFHSFLPVFFFFFFFCRL